MTSLTASHLGESVPRYTSYPTAPHFHPGVGAETVANWISTIADTDGISLYAHIPFCDRLCWFCACHTKLTRRYEPVAAYLAALHAEMRTVRRLLGGRGKVHAVHLGGGSPTLLRPDDLRALMGWIASSFAVSPAAAVSVEIDPCDMDADKLDALQAIGLTRASLGVQDFDTKVQRAINREQSFEITQSMVQGLRDRGVGSINLDLLYGLPHQTRDSLASTVEQSLSLRPDRIALFGYAHVPWFKKHQTMIDEAWLPGPAERLEQSRLAGEIIERSGYVAIGLDHFALPQDSLAIAAAGGTLRRNFQGYTDDTWETLIGLGASSISRYRHGYAQNLTATAEYERAALDGRLTTARGVLLSSDDRMRGWLIERLMCDFSFSVLELFERFGDASQAVLAQASRIARESTNSPLHLVGDRFVVPQAQRAFVRLVASRFDRYLGTGAARHSAAI